MTTRIGWGHMGDDYLHRNIQTINLQKNKWPDKLNLMEASSFCVIQSFEKYDPRRKDGATIGSQIFT